MRLSGRNSGKTPEMLSELFLWERKKHIKKKHVNKIFTGLSWGFFLGGGDFVYVFFLPHKEFLLSEVVPERDSQTCRGSPSSTGGISEVSQVVVKCGIGKASHSEKTLDDTS